MTIYRHTARGTLINGEIFTFGVHSQKTAGVLADADTAWQSSLADMWLGSDAPNDAIGHLYPAATTVVEAVTTELDPVTGKNVAQLRSAPGLVGTGSGAALPPQLAICVSLRTVKPTRAGRGRFFLPAPIVSVSNVGRLDATAQDQVDAAAALMLNDMQTFTYPVVILHRSTMTTDLVTSVDVGDVFDTITTRRDKLVESRLSRSV
jgi:hypothetical protein